MPEEFIPKPAEVVAGKVYKVTYKPTYLVVAKEYRDKKIKNNLINK